MLKLVYNGNHRDIKILYDCMLKENYKNYHSRHKNQMFKFQIFFNPKKIIYLGK